jgi:hypothetical protein
VKKSGEGRWGREEGRRGKVGEGRRGEEREGAVAVAAIKVTAIVAARCSSISVRTYRLQYGMSAISRFH